MNGMTPRFRRLATAAAAWVILGACSGATPTDPLQGSTHAIVDATVQLLNLEGGCWTLEVAPGSHYLPLNLPAQFRQDGLPVRAELLRRDDYGSFCMVGPVVQIVTIQTR